MSSEVEDPVYFSGSDSEDEEPANRRRSYSQCRDATSALGKASTSKGVYLQILLARGAFEGLPIGKHNDMVTGSWWFVWGSLGSALIPIPCLIDIYTPIFEIPEGTALKAFEEASTWIFLIISGLAFTAGSYAFVRAFEHPPRPALLGKYYHFQTDELLGAWLNLAAVLPAIPFTLIYLKYNPKRLTYWGAFFSSVLTCLATASFVYFAYPTEGRDSGMPGASVVKTRKAKSKGGSHEASKPSVTRYVAPMFESLFGRDSWVIKHVANDWLATCWFFFWASALATLASWICLMAAENDRQLYVWITGVIDTALFTVGSAYFCSGSYPPPHEHKHTDHDAIASSLPDLQSADVTELKRNLGLAPGGPSSSALEVPKRPRVRRRKVTFDDDHLEEVRIITPKKLHESYPSAGAGAGAGAGVQYQELVENPLHAQFQDESKANGHSEVDL